MSITENVEEQGSTAPRQDGETRHKEVNVRPSRKAPASQPAGAGPRKLRAASTKRRWPIIIAVSTGLVLVLGLIAIGVLCFGLNGCGKST